MTDINFHYKILDNIIDCFESLDTCNDQKPADKNFEFYQSFLNKTVINVNNSFMKIFYQNKNLDFINQYSLVFRELTGQAKLYREFNSKNFNQNYVNDEIIEKNAIELNKKINNSWIKKMIIIYQNFIINLSNLFIEENYKLFISNTFNIEFKSLITDVYEILEPLIKDIQFNDVDKRIGNLNEPLYKTIKSLNIDEKYFNFFKDNKADYINKSKHNNNYSKLNPFKQVMFFDFCFIFTLIILDLKQ